MSATARFDTLRLSLIKISARVIERVTRIKVSFHAACPDQTILLAFFADRLALRLPLSPGQRKPTEAKRFKLNQQITNRDCGTATAPQP